MDKYCEEIEMEGYKCPYCGTQHTCDDWGFDYDGEVMECDECSKKFKATANHTVNFHSTPDCELNGEKHNLKVWEKDNDFSFCEVCEKRVRNN